MQLPHRRKFLYLAAGIAALPAASRIARAQAYPTRSVRIIVGFPPGGGTDILARLIGQWLSERLNQAFVVENRPGAGANIATETVVRAPADGYTLLMAGTNNAPIAGVMWTSNVVVVHPSFPAKTIPEFIAHAKTNPGRINMASPGIGTVSHMSGEIFKMMTSVNMVHVPYRGDAPAVTDLISGQVQVMFANTVSSIEHIRARRLRALAVTTATRSDALPDVPTVGEFVQGYEANAWWGFGAPKNAPKEIIDKLNREINAGLADLKIKTRLAELGGTALAGSPADFGRLIADETEKWAKVIKFAGIKPE